MTKEMARTQRWHFGEKTWQPFSDKEMQRRQDMVRNHMSEHDIDGCLFTSYHNICYFSGFLFCSFGRRYGLVLDHSKSTTISAGIDGGQPWRRSFGDNITYTDWRRDNFFEAVRELTIGKKRIGIEFDQVNLDLFSALQSEFPGIEFVDIAQAVMQMRTIKSLEEHDLIRQGARLCEVGGRATVDALKAGVPEHEVALASTTAMVREIATSFPFVELMDTWSWIQSGINTDGAHNPVTNRIIESGDIISLNCFPMIFGYYTALERTLFVEHASDQHLKYWQVNCDVHTRGLELIKPGARCGDIAKELNEIYRQHNLLDRRSFGYGHSFGVLSHYYGREAAVELREDIDTKLEPGMVVSMEPMITIPDGEPGAGGYREHDILIVSEAAADNITTFPYGPDHNIIKG